jgi:hypothetical protein
MPVPGVNGTTSLTGRDGYGSCARAGGGEREQRHASHTNERHRVSFARSGIASPATRLVTVRHRDELVVRYHVVDARKRPVARALPHFAQDRVRRILSIGAHDLGREWKPHRLVGRQCAFDGCRATQAHPQERAHRGSPVRRRWNRAAPLDARRPPAASRGPASTTAAGPGRPSGTRGWTRRRGSSRARRAQSNCQSTKAPMKSRSSPRWFQSRAVCCGVSISATQFTSWRPLASASSTIG